MKRNMQTRRIPASTRRNRTSVRHLGYWGDVDFHFIQGPKLSVPLPSLERKRLLAQLHSDHTFFHLRSSANRFVAIRCAAVTDLCFVDKGARARGSEGEPHDLRVLWRSAPEDFWEVIDAVLVQERALANVESTYGKKTVDDVLAFLRAAFGHEVGTHIQICAPDAHDSESARPAVTDVLRELASCLMWQSAGQLHRASISIDDFQGFVWMHERCDPPSFVRLRGKDPAAHCTNAQRLDYISIPGHRFRMAHNEMRQGRAE